jgi:hypothetical protein
MGENRGSLPQNVGYDDYKGERTMGVLLRLAIG